MPDSMARPHTLCPELAIIIGIVLMWQCHAFPTTTCPINTCQPGHEFQGNCGCVPCPKDHYMPDETKLIDSIPCHPFLNCGEGAVRNCSQNGGQCPAHEAQHCVCDLEVNYHGTYPNCKFENCPKNTKLNINGTCIPSDSPLSTISPSSPLTMTSLRVEGTDASSGKTASEAPTVPAHTTTELPPKTETSTSNPCTHGEDKCWTWLFIGIAIGVVGMAVLVLVTLCIVVYIYMSGRGRGRGRGRGWERTEHGRDGEQTSYQSMPLCQDNRSRSFCGQGINGDIGLPMLAHSSSDEDAPDAEPDTKHSAQSPRSLGCPSLSLLGQKLPDEEPDTMHCPQ